MINLSGKCVLVTGASRGIGEAAARTFADGGANVVLAARSADDVTRIAKEIGGVALACDVSRYDDVQAAVDLAVDRFGRLDVLIGNAGVVEPIARITDGDPNDWSDVIDINLKGIYYGVRAAIPKMLKSGGGTIINISSGAAHNPIEGWSHYCASKAGAAMVTQMVHKEFGDAGIRAMGLSPGTVATQMQREIKSSGINPVSQMKWSDHIPPEWVAKLCLWMCGPEAEEYIGQEISLRDKGIRQAIGVEA